VGQWITEKKDLIVEVYVTGSEYKARIVWFSGKHSVENMLDKKNPNPLLRTRKVLGMDVLEGLSYNESDKCWDNGYIYDATSGKTWSATARFDQQADKLTVRGYWGFEILGKSLKFQRYSTSLATGKAK
jgi:uncharacterized protein (DUF2147 family)